MTNTNCLEGIACPKCGADDAVYIEAAIEVLVRDDGTEDLGGDYIWSQDHPCHCAACDHHGRVRDFTVENWPVLQPPLVAEMLDALSAAEEIISSLMAEHDEDEKDVPSIVAIRAAIAKAKKAPASLADPLTAAALDMLEALEAQEMAEADAEAGRRKGYFDHAREIRKAAIAKAKGGAS